MAQANEKLQVLDCSHVSPPPASVPTTSLRLTFFDLPWFAFPNIQRLFFYEFPYPTLYFTDTVLPLLKHSLSLTLQHFFPYAAKLMCPPPPGKPYLRYEDGDFVTFTVVESSADFNHVIANYPRDVKLLRPFAPQLPTVPVAEDGTRVLPVIAFQVTLFPNSGICIGSNYCHVVGDGKTFMHFMRSWSSVHRAGGGDLTCLEKSIPSWNKDVIKDRDGIESLHLKIYWNWVASNNENSGPTHVAAADKVRATFLLGRAHVEKLKHLVTEAKSEQLHISTFVVTCAFIWVCLIKSQESSTCNSSDADDNKFYYFQFPFDCRNRLEFPVPETYFGNCLKPGIAEVKKSELIGENGILLAAKAIGNKVKEIENRGFRDAESWVATLMERTRSGRFVSVSGSPKFYVYDINFGWGRPRKVELVHIDSTETISLAECRDELGGIEVGVASNKKQIDEFSAIFVQSLQLL
ncbi:HXXXD-type acyl-transferase family protein, putative [Theobroma cacao]|uniref:HXXXD-type acyl-transferase family protein, putative n=1 Tax=Theobroma cacao TaxID=3641 RepID=A0A061E894_THECC|nr:HXXXD-type acyl-transferase family protein, putative [Theobroma cacao]